MTHDDAYLILVDELRKGTSVANSQYGYDVYIPQVIYAHLKSENPSADRNEIQRQTIDLSPYFYAAAWELCRRGILRPGVRQMNTQVTNEGTGGSGYSITPAGRNWLAESDKETFIPTEPARFQQLLSPFEERFGPGFRERAQEAARCYRAHAFVACCAMAGAAAESILLALAIVKTEDEGLVLKKYAGVEGRGRVENLIVGKAKEHIQREFRGFMVLLKYWRDQASHGLATNISDNEAYTTLALLLRFAHFANDYWPELTGANP
jgi:hypothetical protein